MDATSAATHRLELEPEPPAARPGAGPSAFSQMAAPRWTALAASAVIALAALGIGANRLAPTSETQAVVASASAATILRNGHLAPLAAETELAPGDAVVAAPTGSVVIRLGAAEARLAGGAGVRIDELDGGVLLEQLKGRVYHRIPTPGESAYVVATGSVTWTAAGTAFVLDREPVPGSVLERVVGTAIERSILLHGPSLAGTLVEGRQATIVLGTETPEVSTAEAPPAWFDDPWLAENARLDEADGGEPASLGRRAAGGSLSEP